MTVLAKKTQGYTLESDFEPIIKGKVQLPNFEELELEKGVSIIAAGAGLHTVPGVNNAKIPGMNSNWGTWARYFLGVTQRGQFDGTGYVMFYDQGKGRIGKFAICAHKFVLGSGANPQRGWNPGRCGTCGLDMSVDSGG